MPLQALENAAAGARDRARALQSARALAPPRTSITSSTFKDTTTMHCQKGRSVRGAHEGDFMDKESANALGTILDQALIRSAEEKARADRVRMESICTDAVRDAVNAQLGADDRKKGIGRSLFSYLLHAMAKAASEYALKKNIDPDDFEFCELSKALSVVDNLRSALVRDWSDKSLDFWDFRSSPIDKIKADKVPYIDRSSLESAVGDYLALPYRSQAMDRFLVRVLIAMELYAFGDEMLNEKTFGLFPARSPLKQRHVFLAYVRGQIVNGVFFAGVAALTLWTSSNGWVSESGAVWISATCAFLFLLFGAISTIALPFAWRKQGNARQHVAKLLSTMAIIYNELRSDGPISAQYIRDRANNAAQEGVVWPAPLFALLDDITSRTGRF
jgi:hypothetical protein